MDNDDNISYVLFTISIIMNIVLVFKMFTLPIIDYAMVTSYFLLLFSLFSSNFIDTNPYYDIGIMCINILLVSTYMILMYTNIHNYYIPSLLYLAIIIVIKCINFLIINYDKTNGYKKRAFMNI